MAWQNILLVVRIASANHKLLSIDSRFDGNKMDMLHLKLNVYRKRRGKGTESHSNDYYGTKLATTAEPLILWHELRDIKNCKLQAFSIECCLDFIG